MDLVEEMDTLKKIKAAKMEAMFPDEVDTPLDQVTKMIIIKCVMICLPHWQGRAVTKIYPGE